MMEIRWEVDDGYVGKDRPQYTEIDDDEICGCETVEDAMKYVEDYVQEDFEMKISWCFRNHDEVEKQIVELLESRTTEE